MPFPIACRPHNNQKPFLPTDLAGLALWLKADSIAGNDGDAVGAWPDSSNNNRNQTQGTADNKPVLKTNILNGKSVVRFDGSNDYTTGAIPAGAAKHWFIIAQKRSAPQVTQQYMWEAGAEATLSTRTASSAELRYYSPGTSYLQIMAQQWQVIEMVYANTGSLTVRADGIQTRAVIDPFDTYATATTLALGASSTGTVPGDFDVAELLLYSAVLGDGDRSSVLTYLNSKYNLYPKLDRQGAVLSGAEAYEGTNVYEPTVIYEGSPQILTGTVFKMWYTGNWGNYGICYAESADGLTWTKYSGNPLLANYARSSVFKSGATYYLFAVNSGTNNMDAYTSGDGVTWVLATAGAISMGGAGAWDASGIANSFVWIEAGTWYCLYEAHGAGGFAAWQIGLATSADGATWTKSASNPVLVLPGMVGGPWVKKVDGTYYLWCHGSMNGVLPTDLMRWSSPDLVTWTRSPGFVLRRVGTDEGEIGTVGQVADPFIIEIGNTMYLYYAASADGSQASGNQRIKLATGPATLVYS